MKITQCFGIPAWAASLGRNITDTVQVMVKKNCTTARYRPIWFWVAGVTLDCVMIGN